MELWVLWECVSAGGLERLSDPESLSAPAPEPHGETLGWGWVSGSSAHSAATAGTFSCHLVHCKEDPGKASRHRDDTKATSH